MSLETLGYTLHRLLPEPCVLVPLEQQPGGPAPGHHDPYLLNLFALRPDAAAALAARGLLLPSPPAQPLAPEEDARQQKQQLEREGVLLAAHSGDWRAAWRELAAGRPPAATWETGGTKQSAAATSAMAVATAREAQPAGEGTVGGDSTEAAGADEGAEGGEEAELIAFLRLYALLCDAELLAADRQVALAGVSRRLWATSHHSCGTRWLAVCCRVAAGIGQRAAAAQAAEVLVGRGLSTTAAAEGAGGAMEESWWARPFLSPSATAARETPAPSAPANQWNAWYEAAALYEAVRLKWFSLAFAGSAEELEQAVRMLQRVSALGTCLAAPADRRLAAVRARQAQFEAAAVAQ